MIYLDNAATSYHKPEAVKKAVVEGLNIYTANSNRGAYHVAQLASMKIMETRENLENFVGGGYRCMFLPSCSYALNVAIRGLLKSGDHVITTYLEHNSVLRVLEQLKNEGEISYTVLNELDETNIIKNIKSNTKLFISTHISNVTGEKCNIELISKICKKHNIVFLLDSAQGLGHVKEKEYFADVIAFAGHKGFRSIIGIGGLLIKDNIKLKPYLCGGTGSSSLNLIQPSEDLTDFEIGSQSAVLISSLNAGINLIKENENYIEKKEKFLTNYLLNKMSRLDFIKLYSNINNCHSVVSFNLLEYDSSLVADILSEDYDICTRSGFHCAPLTHKHFKTTSQGMVRVSLNSTNTTKDIDDLMVALQEINARLKT